MNLTDWLDRRKSRKHDLLKAKIGTLKIEIDYAKITKRPIQEIGRLEKKLKRLQGKLR